MDSPTFVKRVAELSGVDKEIAERVERVDGLLTGTRLDDLLDCASPRHHGRRALERTALQRLRELSSLAELEQAA